MHLEMKRGNSKIGKDTIIFNMGPATDCPSKRLGLCQLENPRHCYARIAELRFPSTLAYRKRQASAWITSTCAEIVADIQATRTKKVKYVRFNESGDFYTQSDVGKLAIIARLLPDLVFYGYTARKDLSFVYRPKNLVICGSGWKRGKMNRFNAVREYTGKHAQCFGDCRTCNLCKHESGITIENKMHGSAFNLLKGNHV